MAEHYQMKYRMKWLDVPRMSQGNSRNADSNVWCGRTSVSMVYNYYQMVKDKPDELIVNRTSKRPYELVFDDEHIVGKFRIKADSPAWKKKRRNNRYMLSDVLNQQDPGWKVPLLYGINNRSSTVTREKLLEILAPVFKSIDNNNPVVIYTSIAASQTLPRHIVVVAGYRLDEKDDVWLLINDPARPKKTALPLKKHRKQEWPGPGPTLFPKLGARYWARALRFFQPNTNTKGDATDLFCDHADRKKNTYDKDGNLKREGGFYVIMNEELVTKDSQYSHIDMGYVYPQGETVDIESAHKYYKHTEKQHKGGYFPLGTNTTWHGGVHLFNGRGRPVNASWRGEIVAVRLLEGDDAIGAYGSRNFILVRHELTVGDLYRVKLFRKLVGYKVKREWNLRESPGGKVVEMQALGSKSLIGGDELELIGDDESHVKVKVLASRLIRVEGYYVHFKKKERLTKFVKLRTEPEDSAELILDLVRGDELKLCDPQPEDKGWRQVEIEKFANRVELVTGYTIKKVRRGLDHLPLRTAPLENPIFWLRSGDKVELVDPQNPGFEDQGGNRWYKVRVKSFGKVKEAARYKVSRSTSFWSKPGEAKLLTLKPGDVLEPDRTFDVQKGKYLRYPMILKEFAPGSKNEDGELRSEAHADMIGRFGWVARERMTPQGVGPRSTLLGRFQGREGWILPRKKNLKAFGQKRAEVHSKLKGRKGYVRYVRANLLDRGPDRRDEYQTGRTGYVALDDAALERLYVLDEKHKERLEGKPFYFLYMHVNNEPLEQSNEHLRKVKWLMSSQVVEYEVLSEFVEFEGAPAAEAGAEGSAESTATGAQSAEPAPAGAFTLRPGDVLTVVKQKEREDQSGRWDRVRIKELAKGGDIVGFEAQLDDYVMLEKASKKGKHVLALRDGDRLALVDPDKPFVRNAEGVWCEVKLEKFSNVQDDIGYVVKEAGGSMWSKAGGPWSGAARKIRLRAGDVLELDRSKRREETKNYTWDYVKVVSLAGEARAHKHRKLIGKSGWIAPRKREDEQKKFRSDLFYHWRDERRVVFADKQGATGWVRWEPSALEPIETKSDRRAAHQGLVETEGLVRYDSGAFEEIKGINEKLVEKIRSGEVVKLEDVKVEPGEAVWTYGVYGRPDAFSDMIHWEVFSEAEFWSVIDGWEKVRDDDADYNMDCETIFRMVPPVRLLKEHDEPKLKNDRGLTAKHVTQFYASDPDAVSLRSYACRFVSEWGINLDSAVPKLKGKFSKAGIKERTRPYLWWDDVFGQAGASGNVGNGGADGSGAAAGNDGLDPHVWHYNPIAFMELFGD